MKYKHLFYEYLSLIGTVLIIVLLTWSGAYAVVAKNYAVGWPSVFLAWAIGLAAYATSLPLRQITPYYYVNHWYTELWEYDEEGKKITIKVQTRGVFTAFVIAAICMFVATRYPISTFPLLIGAFGVVGMAAVFATLWLGLYALLKKPLSVTYVKSQ